MEKHSNQTRVEGHFEKVQARIVGQYYTRLIYLPLHKLNSHFSNAFSKKSDISK